MKKLLAFLLVIACIAASFLWRAVNQALFQPLPYTKALTFDLKKGTSAQSVAKELVQKNLAPHPIFVRLAMRFYDFDKNLKAGEYLLEPQMSLKDILQKLTSGKVIIHKITLVEGLTTAQMLALIEKNKLLSGNITEHPTEGELLPETYTFTKGEAKNAIIQRAKKQMQKTLDIAWQNRAKNLPLQNKEELLILASLIEKETGINSERSKVASVFYNRLNVNMPLQTDPTVIYALTLGQSTLNRSLKHKDLEIDSPYNTYKYKGLPPTPICNPSVLAIQAAANPENTPYFYFVADGNGGHRFAKSLTEHNQNIRLWLKK